jgi:hypothetical protein
MRLLVVVLGLALALPALFVAVALGPVIIGVLCAVGCGFLVFAIVSFFLGLGEGAARAGSRFARH